MLEFLNSQKKINISLKALQDFGTCLQDSVNEIEGKHAAVVFISDRRMKQLNEMFRGKDSTTDVLSFPHEPDEFDPDKDNLGDIVISTEQAQKQAAENGLTFETEIKQLILHGVLHLCGYDHETDDGEMNARELELRDKLGI